MQMNDFHWLVSASAPMSGWLAEDGICMTSEKMRNLSPKVSRLEQVNRRETS